MPTVQTIVLFMTTALALNLTPGLSILFILSRCLGQGRRAATARIQNWLSGALLIGLGVRLAFIERR